MYGDPQSNPFGDLEGPFRIVLMTGGETTLEEHFPGTLYQAYEFIRIYHPAGTWSYFIYDPFGSLVETNTIKEEEEPPVTPPAQGEGGSTEAGGGTGEAGELLWRYRIAKNGADTGQTSGYTYPSREAARDAADALIPAFESRSDAYTIWVEANIAGWEASSYDRPKNDNWASQGENPNQPPTGEPPILPLPPGDGTVTKPVSIASWDNEIAIAATVAIGAAIVYAGYVLISKAVK